MLCLHLKRFKYTNTYRSKLDMHVEFPIKDLDMSNFILNNMVSGEGRERDLIRYQSG